MAEGAGNRMAPEFVKCELRNVGTTRMPTRWNRDRERKRDVTREFINEIKNWKILKMKIRSYPFVDSNTWFQRKVIDRFQ